MPDFLAWRPEDWAALAAWVTAVIALVAGWIALRQLGEARRLRREQAQPYLVLSMEPGAVDPKFVDLVIRNLGTTAAHDVRLRITPTPQRSGEDGVAEDVWLPQELPVLVPHQEWRTLWDFTPDRSRAGLPDRHEATVTYKDSQDEECCTPSVLDWSAYKGRQWVHTYTTHDVGKALREISKTLAKWQEDPQGGLAVFVRDGEAKDDVRQKELQALRARRDAERQQSQAGEEPRA